MKIGSLFSGYGGLDLTVEAVTGAQPAWFCEFDPAPSKVLAHHWPDVPNHKDVTQIDWADVEPVDILTGGSPCQDLSQAGKRAGMTEGTRSNLWVNMREAINHLRPKLVVWENVLGALSAPAESESDAATSNMEQGGGLLAAPPGGHLRALGRVLGDLTEIGYDAEWTTLRASDIGAPHHRARIFLIAWPRVLNTGHDAGRAEQGQQHEAPTGRVRQPSSNTPNPESNGHARQHDSPSSPKARRSWIRHATRGAGSSDVPNPESIGRSIWETQNHRETNRESTTPTNHRDAAADSESVGGAAVGYGSVREGTSFADASGGRRSLPDAECGRWDRRGLQSDGASKGGEAGDPAGCHNRDIEWGKYAPAVRRWERIVGPAPAPTEPNTKGKPRLAAPFAEWMMGLPPGWVTDPAIGLTRSQQLKAIGNGVCPQQAQTALTHLLGRR